MSGLFGPVTPKDMLLPGEHACRKCGLFKSGIESPKMPPYGRFRKRVMVIGEAPGEQEDAAGKPWQGKTGQRLQRELKRLGIDLFEDCLSYNAVNCRPTEGSGSRRTNRTPDGHEIQMCRNHVLRAIYAHKPHVVILLGGVPVESVIGARWTKELKGIQRWRGWTIPDRELKAWVCPTYHPSHVEREESKATDLVWRQDLERALSKLDAPLPSTDPMEEQKCVVIVENTEAVVELLRGVRRVAWDLETTGLKPYDTAAHKVVAASFCPSPDVSYAVAYPDLAALRPILRNPEIEKIAQNKKYDSTWVRVLGRYEVRNQVWDTMLASHVLDNRNSVTGLKFQTYVRFGVVGYDSAVEPYLEGIDAKDGNSVNRIEELMQYPQGRRDVLTYCGADSLFTFKLAPIQMAELGIE